MKEVGEQGCRPRQGWHAEVQYAMLVSATFKLKLEQTFKRLVEKMV